MITIFIILASLTLILGLILLFFIRRQHKSLGILTTGERIYQDTQANPGEVLYAKTLRLIGKPDYLLKKDDTIIPVEFKSGKTPRTPYTNHTMQLMAYCLLVEEHFDIRPPGGYLRYPEKEFKIAYTPEAEEAVRQLVEEMIERKKTNTQLYCNHPEHNPK